MMSVWRKSSYSLENNCLETKRSGPNLRMIRNSKTPSVSLHFTDAEWDAFVKGVKAGEFD
jgi:hypothetical protein